jgi:molybdopterin/thiamine biosynthesis adenylyltransferase
MLLEDGLRITTSAKPSSGAPSTLQRRGLCTIASSLFWQEAIRMKGAMLPIEIPKRYVEVSLRFNPKSAPGMNPQDFSLVDSRGRELSSVEMINREDGTGHWVARARLEAGSELADSLLDSLRLEPRGPIQAPEPAEIEFRIPRQDDEVSGSALIAGAGGLGSWAIHALCGGLSESGSDGSGLRIIVVDPDLEVERHNLNRQVLYSESDIGRPKATCAAERIRESLPRAEVSHYVDALGMTHLEALGENQDNHRNLEPTTVEEVDFPLEGLPTNMLSRESLGEKVREIFSSIDVTLACVDNLRARSLLSAMSAKSAIPMVNAGAQGFNGLLDVFLPEKSCMLCRHGKNAVRRHTRMSCQEDGEVPFSTIVTSTAIFGALQGLALMAALSGSGRIHSWPTQVRWVGRANSFSLVANQDFGIFAGSFESQGDHYQHLEANLVESIGRE